jgi:hypothetical protein
MVTVKHARREADSASVALAFEQEYDRKRKADDAERRRLAIRAARADLVSRKQPARAIVRSPSSQGPDDVTTGAPSS